MKNNSNLLPIVISIVSIVIAAIALLLSILSYKRISKINKPHISRQFVGEKGTYNFSVLDFSTAKNLRVDDIKVKLKRFTKYQTTRFTQTHNKNADPPRIDINMPDIPPLDSIIIKVYTNYVNIKFLKEGIFDEKNPKKSD